MDGKNDKKIQNNMLNDTIFLMIRFMFVLMIGIIILVCCFGNQIWYERNHDDGLIMSNFALLILGITILILLYWILEQKVHIKSEKVIILCSLCFLIFQMFLTWNYYFKTDWDVETIVEAAYEVVSGQQEDWAIDYFSRYPNNRLLVLIYSCIIRIFALFHLENKAYMGFLLFQCVISWGTGLLLYNLSRKLLNSRVIAFGTWGIYCFLIGLSPWVSIPYSDSVGLIFPVAILTIYLKTLSLQSISFFQWYLMISLSYIGYKIKPQIVIVMIAIVLISIVRFASFVWHSKIDNIKRNIKKNNFGIKLLLLTGSVICTVWIVNAGIDTTGFIVDKEKSFGISHFFMMGMNEDRGGVWDGEDVAISDACKSAAERQEVNLSIAKERLQKMGVAGFVRQMHRKLLTNYNDGTFCWGGEGVFYKEVLPEKTMFSSLIRNIYYNREYMGAYFKYFYSFMKMLWLSVLCISLFSGIFKTTNHILLVCMLTLIGLTIFEQIFEARARYIYIYVPIYILLVPVGMMNLKKIIRGVIHI